MLYTGSWQEGRPAGRGSWQEGRPAGRGSRDPDPPFPHSSLLDERRTLADATEQKRTKLSHLQNFKANTF